MLMQGLTLPPPPSPCCSSSLPPVQQRPSSPPPPPNEPHVIPDPEDTLGQAQVRGVPSAPLLIPASISSAPTLTPVPTSDIKFPTSDAPVPTTTHTVSRTTKWRHQKAAAIQEGSTSSKRPRKVYCCGVCGKPTSSEGHTQFRGQRYCPDAPGQIGKEDWLALKKSEAAAKAAAKAAASQS